MSGGKLIYPDGNPDFYESESNPAYKYIKNIRHSEKKKILFKTEDGKDIYEGDAYWCVWRKEGWNIWGDTAKKTDIRELFNDCIGLFSSEEAAKEYVLLSKPMFSIQEIMDRLNGYFEGELRSPAFVNLKECAKQKLNSK